MSQNKILVLAEKPSVGRDIARVLKCNKNLNGALEGNSYIVTWGLGHLVTLADPEGYDGAFKEWKMEYLPMIPEHFKLEVIKQTGKQYQTVKTQLHRSDVTSVIIATDAGREGELVARWILEKAGNKKPMKRLWISSVTDKAIQEGFAHLKDGKEYNNLYRAALSRAKADWLVGINATRALTCKYNAQLSCGRVQTPTLSMILKREEEIKQFVPQPFYGITAQAENSSLTLTWQDKKSKSSRSFDKDLIERMRKELQGKHGVITEVTRKAGKSFSPQLYDLTELQRDANRMFDFSAKETLNIMQRLYENHKVLTYPRTDSRYLTTDVVGTLKERLQACGTGPYRKLAAKISGQHFSTKASYVNNSKVTDHHAIIPTEQYVQLTHMSNEERKIYDLVIRRFLAVLYPPFLYEQTTLHVKVGDELFTASGKVVKEQGWKGVYETPYEDDDDEEIRNESMPDIRQGEELKLASIKKTEGETKPPTPFNEAILLSAMENPVKYMESKEKEDIKTIGETGGLGTVATRADIIEKLFHSFLLEKRGKDIFITSKGKQLLSLVPEDLKKPDLTADWEKKLSKIALGTLQSDIFMKEITEYTESIIKEIKTGDGKFRHDNITRQKCPTCGKFLLSVKGKNSTMLVCQDRECGYRETLARTSNARCPKCHKKLELRGSGEDQVFTCACGYKEKLSAFKTRREKEGAGVSKKDVAAYMKQSKKEESGYNPFADAFSKLNL